MGYLLFVFMPAKFQYKPVYLSLANFLDHCLDVLRGSMQRHADLTPIPHGGLRIVRIITVTRFRYIPIGTSKTRAIG
jgi:hypothetical protein